MHYASPLIDYAFFAALHFTHAARFSAPISSPRRILMPLRILLRYCRYFDAYMPAGLLTSRHAAAAVQCVPCRRLCLCLEDAAMLTPER